MENRIIIPLLCAAALAYACGPWHHAQTPTPSAANSTTQKLNVKHNAKGNAKGNAQRDVATQFSVTPNGSRVGFTLQVLNNTAKSVELKFPNGQTHDFVVLDANGRMVWQWSAGRMFTQAMQSKTVKANDSMTIQDGWDASTAHGEYVAVARLNTDSRPVERRVAFTLP